MKKRIRIGIITKERKIPLWQYSIISKLKNSDFAEIIINIIYNNDEFQSKQKTGYKQPFLWKLFCKIDENVFKTEHNAFLQKDSDLLFNNIPFIIISTPPQFNSLENFKIDVIINFTENKPCNTFINSSKYGVWFLNHCDLEKINKQPYGIWEILKKNPETSAVLRYIKKDMNSPCTIDKTSSCTDSASYKRNLNDLFWQSSTLLINNISLLSNNDILFNEKLKKNKNIYVNSNIVTPFNLPSNWRLIKFIISLYSNKVINLIKNKFFFSQWALIFYNNNNNSDPYSFENYKKILPPKDRFWADPFLVKNNNKNYLFIEELVYKNKLGHLSVMEIDENGNYSKPQEILKKDYHLSYPFIFKDNDDYYMIPETSGNNDIQLYKCIEFPLKWKLEKILFNDIVAVDTTIHKSNDTYWLFTNIKRQEGASKHVELFLYSSKNLITDKWISHPLNPIITDIKKSRPAGSIFTSNNKIFRPSQNCSNYYGYGLNISEIIELSENSFEEKLIHEIHPNWDKNVNSIHTFNFVDNLFIGDIKIKRRRFF